MTAAREYLGIARVIEKDGELLLVFPRKVIRSYGLHAGDVVRLRKLPRKIEWKLTFFRRDRKLLPGGKFVPESASKA